jgi:trimeric autotransporter adhesin
MFSFFRSRSKNRKAQPNHSRGSLSYEALEVRNVLSTFSVVNLADAGAGSLRQAIIDANSAAGADVISFNVAGSIQLTSALPAVTGAVNIDGSTAPGFSNAPAVEVDFNGARGLQFNLGASGSSLRSLAFVDAAGSAVKLNDADNMLLVGNYLGLSLGGAAVGNGGHGVELLNSSGTTIGGDTTGERNVISANRKTGIHLNGSTGNTIAGNYIGTDAAGALDFGNRESGIRLKNGSSNNVVGDVAGNVVSGNDADGIHITGGSSFNRIGGNRIGTTAAGTAALGNSRDGVKIEKSDNNIIGDADEVIDIQYENADDVPTQPVSAWQGIRASDTNGQFLIVGTSDDDGLLFEGTIDGTGSSYLVNYPGALATSVYGPDNLAGNNLRLVGTYRNSDYATAPVTVNGFLFEGTTADLGNAGNYLTIDYPGAKFNYLHSSMGGLVVGNYDNPAAHGTQGLPLGPGHAFIYDIATDTFITDVVFPGSLSNTVYGIWHNGGTSYTLVGGYSLDAVNNFDDQSKPIGSGYMVDFDSSNSQFTNWKSFEYPHGTNYVTHFEGISSVEKGVYTLNADSVQSGSGDPAQGSWVSVRRNADGSFGEPVWVDLNYENLNPATHVTSSNSVYGNQVVGVVFGGTTFSFQAAINTNFQLSNVISGNGGNGITLHKANNNDIARNFIGTDVTGNIDLGNAANGILVSGRSADNMIGGEATGGNNPTMGTFVRPPMGNLISGNSANGVLIHGKSTGNQMSGNFIGTDADGTAAIGNLLDVVAI